MPTVLGSVEEYLIATGYDGLYNEALECACKIGDLEPCTAIDSGCCAGYEHPGDDYSSWYIREEKPT